MCSKKRKSSIAELEREIKKLKISQRKFQMRAPRKIKTKGLKTRFTFSGIKRPLNYTLSKRDKELLGLK